jgi:hypothetical protein
VVAVQVEERGPGVHRRSLPYAVAGVARWRGGK